MPKPTSITVLGILNLILAGLGILGGCYSLVSPLLIQKTNPALAEVYTGAFLAVTIVLGLLAMGSKTLMAASGYGLVKGQAWGRRVGRLWAVISMGLGVVMILISVAYILPATTDAMMQDMNRQLQQQGRRGAQPISPNFMKSILYLSTIGGGLIAALPYQITFLLMMNRKSVNDYFAQQAGGPTAHPASAPASSASASPTPQSNPWQGD